MAKETLERLLQRAQVREVPADELAHYTEDVRRKLAAQPSTVIRLRPQLHWWARLLVPAAIVASLVLVVRFVQPAHPTLRLAEASLEEDAALLDILLTEESPQDSVLPDDDAALLEELEELEELEAIEPLSAQG